MLTSTVFFFSWKNPFLDITDIRRAWQGMGLGLGLGLGLRWRGEVIKEEEEGLVGYKFRITRCIGNCNWINESG